MHAVKIRDEINTQQIKDIIDVAAALYGLAPRDLTSPQRDNQEQRHIAMVGCFFASQASMAEIGRAFNRSHTTVINALRAFDAKLKHATNHRLILGGILLKFDAREAKRKLKI